MSPAPSTTSRALRASRFAFALYAAVLFVGTHWPALRIAGPVPRPDLYIHVVAFALWTALLIACRIRGPSCSFRNVAFCVVIGLLYAGLDEGLQAIPWLRRACAWDDYAANAIGVLLAGAIALVLGRLIPALSGQRATESSRAPQ